MSIVMGDATLTTTLMSTAGESTTATTNPSNNPSDDSVISVPIQDAPDGSLSINIQKVSATANFGIRLDLKRIAFKCRNTEFNPRRHGAIVMRLREPVATGIFFQSGKIIVTEVDSINKTEVACKEFRTVIEKIGLKPKDFGAMEYKVRNIMGTCDCGFPLRLEELSYAHSDYCSYEPEVFPGLVYRLDRTEVVVLIFASGKIVLTGSNQSKDLVSALTKLYPILLEYKKKFRRETHSNPSTPIAASTPGTPMEEG